MNIFDKRLIGKSVEFTRVKNTAQLIAAADVTVLVSGESGTGKECVAEVMHAASPRADHAFVTLNCAAVADGLFEATLFGYKKGAFAGAHADQQGHIITADGGTLFLDEVGELSLSEQGSLLRFLERQEVQPLGDTTTLDVDVRVIAATHQDLLARVQNGVFRKDLYYRLNVIPLEIPPLRERREDVSALFDFFLKKSLIQHGLPSPRFTPAAKRMLKSYTWPGNVRELRNLCERMVVLFQDQEVDVQNLPQEIRATHHSAKVSLYTLPAGGIDLNALEADVLQQAIQMSSGNRSAAARLLSISRDTLLYRLQKFSIS